MYVYDYLALPAASFIGTYLITSHILAILDWTQPEWYKAREISPRPKLTFQLYMAIMKRTILNIPVSVAVAAIFWHIRITRKPELRDILTAILQLLICFLCSELWFWTGHYLSHNPLFYAKVHSLHHTFPRPIALSSLYCTLWEMLLINLPLATGMPTILQLHPYVNSLWNCGLAWYIAMKHC